MDEHDLTDVVSRLSAVRLENWTVEEVLSLTCAIRQQSRNIKIPIWSTDRESAETNFKAIRLVLKAQQRLPACFELKIVGGLAHVVVGKFRLLQVVVWLCQHVMAPQRAAPPRRLVLYCISALNPYTSAHVGA